MNQQGDDKELMAAFAEFKELLKRDAEPATGSRAPAVTLEPQFGVGQADAPTAVPPPPRFPAFAASDRDFAPPVSPAQSGAGQEWTPAPSSEDALLATQERANGGRRKLIYLSVAIVVAGLAGLGWTLSKWRAPADDPSIADISLPEPDAAAPEADQATLGQSAPDAAAAVEGEAAAPAEKAELNPPAEAAPVEPAAPLPAARVTPAPVAAAPIPLAPPPVAVAPRPAATAPASRAAAIEPVAPAPGAAVAPVPAATGGAVARLTPPSAPAQPTNRFIAPPPETPAAEPTEPVRAEPKASEPKASESKASESKLAAPAKATAKPKPKPSQAAKKPKPRAPDPAPAAEAAAAPERPAPPPPPPPPQNEGGAFGFVKRAVNSVGSAIGSVGRTVVP